MITIPSAELEQIIHDAVIALCRRSSEPSLAYLGSRHKGLSLHRASDENLQNWAFFLDEKVIELAEKRGFVEK